MTNFGESFIVAYLLFTGIHIDHIQPKVIEIVIVWVIRWFLCGSWV